MKQLKVSRSAAAMIALYIATVMHCGPSGPQLAKSTGIEAIPQPNTKALIETIQQDLATRHRNTEQMADDNSNDKSTLAAAFGELGKHYHAHRFPKTAKIAYRNARYLEPKNPEWAYRLGSIYAAEDDQINAEAAYREVLDLDKKHALAWLRLGDVLLAGERWDEAEKAYQKASALQDDLAAAYYGLGRIAAQRNDDPQTIEYLEKALTAQPEASIINYPLGLAHRRLGHREEAAQLMAKRGNAPLKVEDPFALELEKIAVLSQVKHTVILAGDHAHFSNKDFMGYVRSNLRSRLEIGELLEAVIQRKVQDGNPDPKEISRLHFAIADLLDFHGKKDIALHHFELAARMNPDYEEAVLRFITAHVEAGNFNQAMIHVNRYLIAHPGHVAARIIRASAQIGLATPEDVTSGIQDLMAILKDEPKQVSAYSLLSRAYFALGKGDKARDAYRQILDLDLPANEMALHFHTYGKLVLREGNFQEARQYLELALERDPKLTEAKFDLAGVLGYYKEFGEAARLYAEVLEKQPTRFEAITSRVASLIFAGNLKGAAEALKSGMEALPNNLVLQNMWIRMAILAPEEVGSQDVLTLAEELRTRGQGVLVEETWAMVLARENRLEEAIQVQSSLLSEMANRLSPAQKVRLEANLGRYKSGQICCNQPLAEILLVN